MLLLRALPLSFAIFWRFLLVLPLWVTFYTFLIAFIMWAFFASLSLGLIGLLILAPVLGLLSVAITYIIAVHPYLVATRIGLRARGIQTEYSDKRIFGAAIGYGIFEAVVGSIIAYGFAVAAMLIAQQGTNFALLNPPQITDPTAELATEVMKNTPSVLIIAIALVIMALRAALLPVLAQAAAGRTPEGHAHTPLSGFGQSFAPLMVLMFGICAFTMGLQVFIGNAESVFGLVGLLTDGLRDAISLLTGQRAFAFDLNDTIVLVGLILLSIWLFSLQCAGAVASFESRITENAAKKQAKVEAIREETADIGDLLRARMPKRQG